MVISLEDFASIRNKIKSKKVLVVGDIMLDRYVWGDSSRVSEESPVLVVEVDKKDERLGGAGNVVNNLVNLGCQVSLAGVVGADFYGEKVVDRLKRMQVDASGVLVSTERPTTTKKRVIARGQQVLRIDEENRAPIGAKVEERMKNYIAQNFESYSAVIVSDYAKGVLTPGMLDFFYGLRKKHNCTFNHKPIMVDPKPANRNYYRGLNIVKPNRKEAESIADFKINDLDQALKAAKIIQERLSVDSVLLSLGGDGLLFYNSDYPQGVHSSTLARKVFDVSGAGDAVVSCFTTAVANGFSVELAMAFANFAAAYVVSEVGTIALDLDILQNELDYYYSKN